MATAAKKTGKKTAASKKKVPASKKATATKAASKKKPASKAKNVSPEQRYQMVAQAAYYIAERNGFSGDDTRYWLEAEAEIHKLLLS
jgi:hypothetical protein